MYSAELKKLLSQHPEWEAPLAALTKAIKELPPTARLKPRVIARESGIRPWEALALLRMLQEAGLGQVRIQVRDPRRGGLELATYADLRDVPLQHPDALGEEFEVSPEDVQIVFLTNAGLQAAERDDQERVEY